MRKILCILFLSFAVTAVYSQNKPLKSLSSAKDDSYTYFNPLNQSLIFTSTSYNSYSPAGNVPFGVVNYNDYGTNGNNMRKTCNIGRYYYCRSRY